MNTPRLARVPGLALLFAAMLFCLFPFFSMLSAALHPQGSIPQGFSWPAEMHWENFATAFDVANFGNLLTSSGIYVLGVVPVAALIATMAGYALAQLRIPGGKIFYVALLVGLTLPAEVIVIPLYYQLRGMGLLDSYFALILPLIGINMPFAVFWMRAHFMNVPVELSEAANMDGAGPWKSFTKVQLPLSVPAISSLALLLFLSTWNQFLLAIVLVEDPNKRTAAVALQGFVGKYGSDLVLLNAGALLIMAPTIIVFLILQRQFVRALLQGSVKG